MSNVVKFKPRAITKGRKSSCRIKPLIAEFSAVVLAYDAADEANEHAAAMRCSRRMEAIKASAMTTVAKSVEGALFQLAVASAHVDVVGSDDAGDYRGALEEIEPALVSAMRTIASATGAKLDCTAVDFLTGLPGDNPRRLIDHSRRGDIAKAA